MESQSRAVWPALAGALMPKCPLCVAAWLSAAGAGAAAGMAPVVVVAGRVAAVLAVVFLGVRLLGRARRTRRYRRLVPFAACALALLAATLAAPALLWPRLVALAGLVLAASFPAAAATAPPSPARRG
jgi:hypothetical protein